jgi:hypothetical protein
MHFHFPSSPKNVYFFCSSEIDHVVTALNSIVKTCMANLAVTWDDSGYSKSSIQQRCEAVKKHVQVNVVYNVQVSELSVCLWY